jgi:hypothetical protein
MTIEERVREIMLSEELPDSEKLDRLHALIPPEVFKIDNLNKATPAQLKRLKEETTVVETWIGELSFENGAFPRGVRILLAGGFPRWCV